MFIRLSSGDYTEHIGLRLGKTDKQNALFGKTRKQKTILPEAAMLIIIVFFPQGIGKGRERIGKVKIMFLDIVPVLFFVPHKPHIDPLE
jgi:hypothetical protein